jgi:hypothetical protein
MSLSSRSHAISVVIMAWNDEHRAFVIETYFKMVTVSLQCNGFFIGISE